MGSSETSALNRSVLGGGPALCHRIREGWERFVADGIVPESSPVRPFALDRWRTAREHGIDPFLDRAPLEAGSDDFLRVLEEDEFPVAGRRVLGDLAPVLAGAGHALLLSDANGRLLCAAGDPAVRDPLHLVNAQPGGLWGEDVTGPNGVGTSLTCRRPVVVFGAEHFCSGWHEFVCYGAPVRDPLNAQLLGSIALAGVAERATTDQLPFVISVVHSVEYLLVESRRYARQRLLDAYERAESRWPLDAIAAFDSAGNVIAANVRWHEVEERLGAERCRSIYEQATAELLKSPAPKEEARVKLSDSEARVVVVNSVRAANRLTGVVVVLERHGAFAGSAAPDASLGGAFEQLIGRDPEFRRTLRIAARAAASDESVLITGPTGTGKELVATAIHRSSRRANKPLVSVNCAALPRDLIESELLGYEAGAFTGARKEGKPGRFELANSGTLFLDEIGDLPLEVQAKLLRVLEERVVFRVGGSRPRPVDVRIVAATNRDLVRAMGAGEFRADLFYRLDVIKIDLPALRTRGSDILELTKSFIETMCRQSGRAPLRLTPEVEELLLEHSWPGNVRELRNVVARLVVLADGDVVEVADLPASLSHGSEPASAAAECSLHRIEDDLIRRSVEAHAGNISQAARQLGIDRSTIYRRLRRVRRETNRSDGEL